MSSSPMRVFTSIGVSIKNSECALTGIAECGWTTKSQPLELRNIEKDESEGGCNASREDRKFSRPIATSTVLEYIPSRTRNQLRLRLCFSLFGAYQRRKPESPSPVCQRNVDLLPSFLRVTVIEAEVGSEARKTQVNDRGPAICAAALSKISKE